MSTQAVTPATSGYKGTDKLLLGIVLAVLTFWLFAGSAGTVAPVIMNDINSGGVDYVDVASMNLAVSITALFSGLFIVLMGGLADKLGRVKITLIGILAGIVGSLLLIFAAGPVALPLLLVGRAIQGFSAACIMPSTMALVKTYWDGPGRQRAVSMWSIGSWGGSGLSAIFGGAAVQYIGWRGIFITYIVISLIAFLLIRGTPESRVEKTESDAPEHGFDFVGLIIFIVATLSMMVVLLFGSRLGWTSFTVLGLVALSIIAWVAFVMVERGKARPFIDFALFKNITFTGATISNFLLNCSIGMLLVSQQLLQLAGRRSDGAAYTAFEAGILTLGYAIFIIAFIRVGEKLLQRFGPRKPMIWGTLIVMVAAALLAFTSLHIGAYVILAVIAYCLFGLGLAFYATPSTDAALSNLPPSQAGAGSGIYKMASSLGSAIGAAVSLAVFAAIAAGGIDAMDALFTGRTDNIALREGGMAAMIVNLVFLVCALISIMVTIPKSEKADR